MESSTTERYLLLGLRVGRLVDGMVDAYFGPPELSATVEAEPPPEPARLVADAQSLLDELADGWLRDQVVGLRTYAGVLAGEPRGYADEVEGCYGVRPTWTDESVFSAAHERLAELLPGSGPVAQRYQRWRAQTLVPTDLAQPLLAAVIAQARTLTRRLIELPEGEEVGLEIVEDVPWLAYNEYLGGLRSRVSVNVSLPMSGIELLHRAVHESYPGHHVERSCKEYALVRGRGLLEETLVSVPTPQSLVTEGIAELARYLMLDGDAGAALAGILHGAGVPFDLEHALAVEHAMDPCRWAEVNAALLRYERGADGDEVHRYLVRWGLLDDDLAVHLVRFLADPTSRSYVICYPAGRELCTAWAAGDPARFRRLLTEQVRVRDLLETGALS